MSATSLAERVDQAPANVEQHPASDRASLLTVITKAASDDKVDIDKMERLMAMHERMVERDALQAFNTAMKEAQREMRPISADAENPQTRSKYASYAKLDQALRPIYTRHGFALSFDEGDTSKPEHIRVLCYVSHDGGYTRTYHKDMPADGKGAKGGDVMTKTHASGAADSYGARYILKKIFNVAVGGDDKDGNAVSATITEDQVEELAVLIDKAVAVKGGDRAEWLTSFLEYLAVPALLEIPKKRFGEAKAELERAIKGGAKK